MLRVFVSALNAPGELRTNMDNVKRIVENMDELKQRVQIHLAKGEQLHDEVEHEVNDTCRRVVTRERFQESLDAENPVQFLTKLQPDDAKMLLQMLTKEFDSTRETLAKLKEWKHASITLISACKVLGQDIDARLGLV